MQDNLVKALMLSFCDTKVSEHRASQLAVHEIVAAILVRVLMLSPVLKLKILH